MQQCTVIEVFKRSNITNYSYMINKSKVTNNTNISNRVTMKISEDIFFELMKLKGNYRAKSWDELFKKIIDENEKKN